jgi:large subunit ribosomal protein L6
MPLQLPSGVSVKVHDGQVRVEGPKGKLARVVEPEVTIVTEGNTVHVRRQEDTRRARSIHGLMRKLLGNMVDGVGKGFSRVLEINGVGYRAEARGSVLFMTLGYSHPIAFQLPQGITAKVDKQVTITLEGADRELLGQTAAAIRKLRGPEPYKGKGIKYAEERIQRKAGKSAAGATR